MRPGYNATVRLASAGAVRRYGPMPTVRERCWDGPATASQSGRTCQALSGATARCQQQGGASGVAWLQCNCLAGLGRCRPELQPRTDSKGALLGWPGYSGTVWLALVHAIRCCGPVPAARGCFWCGLALAAWSGWPWQANPVRQPGASGEGLLPGRPGYSSTGQLAPEGTIQHSGQGPVARKCWWDSPVTTARSGRHWHLPSCTAAWWWQ